MPNKKNKPEDAKTIFEQIRDKLGYSQGFTSKLLKLPRTNSTTWENEGKEPRIPLHSIHQFIGMLNDAGVDTSQLSNSTDDQYKKIKFKENIDI